MHRGIKRLTLGFALLLLAFLQPLPTGTALAAEGGDYDALVGLYKDIRADAIPTRMIAASDLTAAAIQARAAKIPGFRQRLSAIDPGKWPVPQRVDYFLVRAALDNLDFEHRVLHPWSASSRSSRSTTSTTPMALATACRTVPCRRPGRMAGMLISSSARKNSSPISSPPQRRRWPPSTISAAGCNSTKRR
jgi:hypothetical protein